MTIEFRAEDGSTHRRLEGQVVDWARGLRERKVAQIELYNQHAGGPFVPLLSFVNQVPIPLALVVTLVDESLYLIERLSKHGNSPMNTIKNITPSSFNSRPIIAVKFYPPYIDLSLILRVCCSVPRSSNHEPEIDSRCFGLIVLLNTVQHVLINEVLPPTCTGSPQGKGKGKESSTEMHYPLEQLWKGAYRAVQSHDHDFWEGSVLERTRNLIRELIYKTAYEALQDKLGQTVDFETVAYSTMARVGVLASKESAQPSLSDMSWDKSWNEHTQFKRFGLTLGNNARQLSSQTDARDLPHRYGLSEIANNADLVHKGLIWGEWGELTRDPSCTLGLKDASQILPGNTPNHLTNNSCGCYVWISDWQIATHHAWSLAWPKAFIEGRSAVDTTLRKWNSSNTSAVPGKKVPASRLPSTNPDPAIIAIMKGWEWLKDLPKKKEVDGIQPSFNDPNTSERRYQDLKVAARQTAKRELDENRKPKDAESEAEKFRAKYKDKASKRAIQTMRQHHLAREEWQKLSTNSVLRYLPEQGSMAKKWKQDFQDTCEQAWSGSWEDAWLVVWKDAFQLAESKGIEFGVEVGLEMRQGPCSHKALLNDLMKEDAYTEIKRYVKQEKVEDILSRVRSLIQDLSHISSFVPVHKNYGNIVTIRALVPDKDQDLEGMSRILPKQPVSRELSYLELRHFVREECFKKKLRQHRASFQNDVSRSWRVLPEISFGGDNER